MHTDLIKLLLSYIITTIAIMDPRDLPYEKYDGKYVLGIEGSANKIGVGVVDFLGNILSNPR